jgi:predicted acetyltransferase
MPQYLSFQVLASEYFGLVTFLQPQLHRAGNIYKGTENIYKGTKIFTRELKYLQRN